MIRPVLLAAAICFPLIANDKYEVWAIDQSNSFGKSFGGALYIWNGHDLENKHKAPTAPFERIDLGADASALCLALTGANPVRPHMLFFNAEQSHAVVAFVGTGHVLILNAATRQPVHCLRMSPGAGGAIQAHAAVPSPDGSHIVVANQNGKLLERINTNWADGIFEHDPDATLNLAACLTPNGVACEAADIRPDNAPICPLIESSSQFTFVTLRGGGLFVVNHNATPMEIVGEYDMEEIHGNGCGGNQIKGRMFLNSGGGTAANLYEADLYSFPLTGYSALNPPNVPARRLVMTDDVDHADGHGTVGTKHDKYVWMADRGRNLVFVADAAAETLIGHFVLSGPPSSDATPDLMVLSPNGSHVFASFRGPSPLSGDPHVSTGNTPGVGVIKVLASGRQGVLESVAPVTNKDAAGVERADVHALGLRLKR